MASQSSPIELGAAVSSRPRYFPDQSGLTCVYDGPRDLGQPSVIPDGFPVPGRWFAECLSMGCDPIAHEDSLPILLAHRLIAAHHLADAILSLG